MKIVRDGKEYVMTDEEVFNAADAIIWENINPNYKIKRGNKEFELTKEEHRSCLLEWALKYMERQKKLDREKKEMNKK